MYIAIIVIHLIACIFLILTILLQAGRGGGLTEAFGGETTQSLLGTQAPHILKKATTISAIVFLCTSLLLGIMTARSSRSLFDRSRIPIIPVVPQAPATSQTEATQPDHPSDGARSAPIEE